MLYGVLVFLAALTAANAMKCYSCKSTNGPYCVDGQCIGQWCTTIITEDRVTNTKTIENGCSQANPANSGVDSCSKEVSGTSSTTKCGCQLEDYCNSESGMNRLQNDKNAVGKSAAGQGGNVPTGNSPPVQGGNVGPNGAPNGNNVSPPVQPLLPAPSNQPSQGGVNPNQPPPPGPQPFPGPNQGPNVPPPQGGQDFNNSNNNPQLPRFPPLQQGNTGNNQPDLGPNPNIPNNVGPNNVGPNNVGPNNVNNPNQPGAPRQPPPPQQPQPQPQPQPGVNVNPQNPQTEPEGVLKNFTTTTISPNGQQPVLSDKQSLGDKYSCLCYGPPYCVKERCRGEFCAVIEFSTADVVRSPGQPAPPANSGQTVPHLGCAGKSINGVEINVQKVQKVPYDFVMNNKQITVTALEHFCTGDVCNSSAKVKFSLLSTLIVSFVFLLFR